MQKLRTVNADTLLYEPLEKPSFVVDGLIPTGLTLFCGSQKIGKSWLMLKLCLCVSQGIPLWDMPTQEGDVLYLCLEDTFCRIQDRLLLSGSEQTLINAIFFEELSEREVGLRLGIMQSVVNKRKAKILAKLRKIMENKI